jgi:hypothetical protein
LETGLGASPVRKKVRVNEEGSIRPEVKRVNPEKPKCREISRHRGREACNWKGLITRLDIASTSSGYPTAHRKVSTHRARLGQERQRVKIEKMGRRLWRANNPFERQSTLKAPKRVNLMRTLTIGSDRDLGLSSMPEYRENPFM